MSNPFATGKPQDSERSANDGISLSLELLTANSPLLIGAASLDGALLFMNEAGRQLLGLPSTLDVRATHLADHVLPADRAALRRRILPAVLNAGRWHGELRLRHHQRGEAIAVDFSLFLVRERNNGEPLAFAMVSHDVREQQQRRAQLDSQYALLAAQIETSQDGILVVAPDGRWLSVNQRFLALWQIPATLSAAGAREHSMEHALDSVADRQGFAERIRYLYAHPDAVSDEEVVLKDGRTLQRYSAPLESGDGRMVGRVWYYRDISDRKRAEETLREQARFLRLLNEITQAALGESDLPTVLQVVADRLGAIIHADGCFISVWDDATQRTLAMAASGAQRERFAQLLPEPGEATLTEAVLRAGHVLVAEDALNSPDISRRLVEAFHIRSMLGLPLITGNRKFGAALISFNQPHHFTPEEIAQGEQAAAQIALIIAQARLFEQVQRLATVDDLTGALNRRHLFELGSHEVRRAERSGHPLSAIMLDVDNFKTINDSFGHAAGDHVLHELTRMCLREVRSADIVGRYGGEEFVLLLPETDEEAALGVAQRIGAQVATSRFVSPKGEVRITVSMGVAVLRAGDEDFFALVNRADHALYRAKRAGRNFVVAFDSPDKA